MEDFKNFKPKIISAVDLTHLQPQERLRIIGNKNLEHRREFLTRLVKAGIMVGLPMLLSQACEPEIIYLPTDEEDCPEHNPCDLHQACTCQSDATASVPPKVVNTVPENASKFTHDPDGVEIRMDIDKAMDPASLSGAITVIPEPSGGFDIHFYDLSKGSLNYKTSLALHKPGSSEKLQLLANTTYTVTLKGTAKDINGNYLDGDYSGTGGSDFTFNFETFERYESCICQSDCSCVGYSCSCVGYSGCSCESYTSCSCQSYTCTCVGFYCSCQYAGCPLYRI